MGEGESVAVRGDFEIDKPVCAGVQVVQGIFDALGASGSSLPLLPEALGAFDTPVIETHRHRLGDVLVDLYVMYHGLWLRWQTDRVNVPERELMTRIENRIFSWGDTSTLDV